MSLKHVHSVSMVIVSLIPRALGHYILHAHVLTITIFGKRLLLKLMHMYNNKSPTINIDDINSSSIHDVHIRIRRVCR